MTKPSETPAIEEVEKPDYEGSFDLPDPNDPETQGGDDPENPKDEPDVEDPDSTDEDVNDDDLSEEEQAEADRIQKKAEELGVTPEEVAKKEAEEQEAEEAKRIEEEAKAEGVSVDEYKKHLEAEKKIIERHGDDPIKLARAIRKNRSDFQRIEAENKRYKEAEKANAIYEKYQKTIALLESDPDKYIDQYRREYPNESEELSDEVITDRLKAIAKVNIERAVEKEEIELKEQASKRKEDFIENLSESDRKFESQIKEALSLAESREILSPDFKIEDVVRWVKGKTYDDDVKAAYERGLKAGQEQPRILGKRTGAKTTPRSPSGKVVNLQLSDAEKERAEQIYGSRSGWTKQQMYLEYIKNDKDNDF